MDQFEKVIKEGYSFEMGKYFDEGWNMFKKEAGSYIGFTLLYFIISMAINIIPFFGLLSYFVQFTLMAGMFIFMRKQLSGNQEFGDFFSGFNYFGQIVLYLLVLTLFAIPLLIILFGFIFPFETLPGLISGNLDMEDFGYEMASKFEGNIGLIIALYFVFLAGIFYLFISYSLVLPLIADAKLGFWKAMETSRKIVAKQFLSFVGFYLVIGLIYIFGTILTCVIGILAILPWIAAIQFSLYDNIVKPSQNDLSTQIAGFGQSSQDINTESGDRL
jgi:hypothetical protein